MGDGEYRVGLTLEQQKAIDDLWNWQERSLRSEYVLGGPCEGIGGLEDGVRSCPRH